MKRLDTKYVVAIIISLILGASILGYGYLDYIYKKEALNQKALKEEQDLQIKTRTQQMLNDCLAKVEGKFQDTAKLPITLESRGVKIVIDEYYQKQKDECFKKYPLN